MIGFAKITNFRYIPTLISSESNELMPDDSLSIGEHNSFVVDRQSKLDDTAAGDCKDIGDIRLKFSPSISATPDNGTAIARAIFCWFEREENEYRVSI